MEKAKLRILEADIGAQLQDIEQIFEKVTEQGDSFQDDEARLIRMAYYLHNLYNAFEDLFEIVAGHFENNIEDPSKWHKLLLKRMATEIEGVRPALISKETHLLLGELRAFRHLFRHAYSIQLDPQKVQANYSKALQLKETYEDDIALFLSKLG